MIYILLITHGSFGAELLRSAELIVGQQKKVYAFGLEHGDSVDELRRKAGSYIARTLDAGDEILVMVDMRGGSPFNVAAANLNSQAFPMLTGVNLPMLIQALDARTDSGMTAEKLARLCIDAAREGVMSVQMHDDTGDSCHLKVIG